jgi:hypothetical protein
VQTTPFYIYKIQLNIIHHLCLRLPSGFFSLAFLPITYTPSSSPIRATCPTYLNNLDKSCSSLLCSFLHPPVTPFLFGPNILLSTCSQTPSVYFPPLMSKNMFHITGKTIFLYIRTFTFFDSRREDRRFRTEW